jgi:predicted NBD/HSP70 family sugar kinase
MSEPFPVDAALGSAVLPESAERVMLEILIHGPLSRVELAQRLGLSGPSLTRLTKPLIASGRLLEREPLVRSMGRPMQPLDLDPSAEHFAGVKITIDAVHSVITDMRGVVKSEREDTLDTHDASGIAQAVARGVTALAVAGHAPVGVGISLGGNTADGRVVRESHFLGWRDVPFAALVEDETGLPCVVANDVNALTQAQHWFGEGRGLNDFAVVTIGAGIGLGVVAAGELIVGAHGALGSIGHQLLLWSDATCWRGHHGCASAVLSTEAIEKAAAKQLGRDVSFDDILRGAERGDPALRRVVDLAGESLGLLLANVTNTLDPQKIVLAGEGARLGEVGEHAMLASFRDAMVWDTVRTPIQVQPFAFNEWARGAAAMAIRSRMLRGAQPQAAETSSNQTRSG